MAGGRDLRGAVANLLSHTVVQPHNRVNDHRRVTRSVFVCVLARTSSDNPIDHRFRQMIKACFVQVFARLWHKKIPLYEVNLGARHFLNQ